MEDSVAVWTPDDIFKKASSYLSSDDMAKVKKAYWFANRVHAGQTRASGEAYITHPIQVAGILVDLNMDADTISAGFLHDVVEDTETTNDDLVREFGKSTAQIVSGVTKLSKIKYKSNREELAENHRKLLLAMSKDIRVMIVKLADRLHNMETLQYFREEKQKRIAAETLKIYAPLADRLGIGTIKWELEDLSLRYLNPDAYYQIVNLMDLKRTEREKYVAHAVDIVTDSTKKLNIKSDVYGRPKHIYSIYKKMHNKHKDFKEIYDLMAVRVITDSVKDCYAVLGTIHTKWKPIPGRFKDYIAVPKQNMYQSLHTTVIGPGGEPLEIQIRTKQMDQVAEYGVAAHWAYKRGETDEVKEDKDQVQLNWYKRLIEIQEDTDNAADFMDAVTGDLFSENVYVFTPNGDVMELPKESTPIDMAYAIHSDVGNTTTGAKVNGKLVPLDYQVQNGDIIDIITSANSKGPGANWLSMVKTKRAKHKIKQFFKQNSHDQDITQGKHSLENSISDSNFAVSDVLTDKNLARVADEMHYTSVENLLAAIGFGDIQPQGVVNRLLEPVKSAEEKAREDQKQADILNGNSTISNEHAKLNGTKPEDDVVVSGTDNLLVNLSKCCTPVPGDSIDGYITKGNGISIHRSDCPNLVNEENGHVRLINTYWAKVADNVINFDANLRVFGYNRPGILNDVLKRINASTKNVNSVEGKVKDENLVVISVSVGVRNAEQLDHIIDGVKEIADVYDVSRPYA